MGLRHHLLFRRSSVDHMMLSGHSLPRPSQVPTTRPIAHSNSACRGRAASRHGRHNHHVSCDASGRPSEDDSAQQDVRARIAAAKQYRERVGLPAASGSELTDPQRRPADAVPASTAAAQASSTGRAGSPATSDSARLHEAVANYGDAWAAKLEGQYTAAREQLQTPQSQAAPSSADSEPSASEPTLVDLVAERLSKRQPAAPERAPAGGQPTASTSSNGAGEFRADRGSATQAAGFLAGFAARPPPAPAAPDERPGPLSRQTAAC